MTRPLDRPLVFALLLLALGPACGKERPFSSDVTPPEGSEDPTAAGALQPAPAPAVSAPIGGVEPTDELGAAGGALCASNDDCPTTAAPVCDQAVGSCTACLSSTDCPSEKPLCKLDGSSSTRNVCVECTSDTECGPAAPLCDLSTNQCTSRCQDSAQCSGATPVCDLVAELCVQCLTSGDCSAPTPACDITTARCVQCIAGNECPLGTFCNTETHACVGCLETSQCLGEFNAHCQTDPALPDPFTCVGCIEDRDCSTKEGLGLYCRLNDGKCVQCRTDADCTDNPNATSCSPLGTCGACVTDLDCAGIPGRTACLAGAGCVECTNDTQCAGNPRGPLCKTSTTGEATDTAPLNTCVECTSDIDCTDPNVSACQDNECVPCQTNADCGHVDSTPGAGGTPLNVCDAGSCVECTGLQREACGANVCDSSLRQCTTFPTASAELCEPCVSDAHCGADARCVQQTIAGQDFGVFCFPLAVGTPGTCDPNFFILPATRTTLDTPSADVCLLRQATCPAFRAHLRSDSCLDENDSASCGGGAEFGGICVLGPAGFGCTVRCNGANDCRPAASCLPATGTCEI